MIGLVSGALLDFLLAPLFIFVFNLGIFATEPVQMAAYMNQ